MSVSASSQSGELVEVTHPESALETCAIETDQLLDNAARLISAGNLLCAFRLLASPLSRLWAGVRDSEAAAMLLWKCREHNLFKLTQRDPFTNRAATKPRGYAGDAVMMDYLYQGVPQHCEDELAKSIFACTTRSPTSLSVCFRRHLLRGMIDDTVSAVPQARILSVACGHARELEGSLVCSPLFDGEFVALDQDPLSCEEVERSYHEHRVLTLNMGIVELLKTDPAELGGFDLIYSAGLYDYLSDVLARRLTKRLFRMLRPGGRLLIANFVPDTAARAYMEIFMDWHLIYRNEDDMLALARSTGADVRTFIDPHRNVVYAEMTR